MNNLLNAIKLYSDEQEEKFDDETINLLEELTTK